MGNKTKSFLSAVALAFAVLFFGPATSQAYAEHRGPNPRYQRDHRPYYSYNYNYARPYSGYGHGYARPYYGRSYYRHDRPYRLVRVFVYDPFPRWVYRRVYNAQRAYYDYAPPVGSYCSPY
jgi:hypothetical protein